MSFRTSLLAVADAARTISGPTGLDIRTNQLTIRTRTWSGTYLHDGTSTDVDLVLPARYPVRRISAAEIASSGGEYEMGDIAVAHITPYDGVSVGYTQAQLNPTVTSDNVEIRYVITGSHAGDYGLVECQTYRPFSYRLILRRRADSTP